MKSLSKDSLEEIGVLSKAVADLDAAKEENEMTIKDVQEEIGVLGKAVADLDAAEEEHEVTIKDSQEEIGELGFPGGAVSWGLVPMLVRTKVAWLSAQLWAVGCLRQRWARAQTSGHLLW